MKLINFWNAILELVFPPICIGCKRGGLKGAEKLIFLCNDCQGQIEINNSFFCSECMRRLPEPEKRCHKQAQFILAAACFYKSRVLKEMILSLKYAGVKKILKMIDDIFKTYLENLKADFKGFIIVPLPIHKRKERLRGFNQALLLAKSLEKACNLTIEPNLLLKNRNTPSQTNLEFSKRIENVKDSFVLNDLQKVRGKNVIIVDDVFTSGATMKEAARVLKEAGAKKIIAFVLARA